MRTYIFLKIYFNLYIYNLINIKYFNYREFNINKAEENL